MPLMHARTVAAGQLAEFVKQSNEWVLHTRYHHRPGGVAHHRQIFEPFPNLLIYVNNACRAPVTHGRESN
jgi:hypothetical protein